MESLNIYTISMYYTWSNSGFTHTNPRRPKKLMNKLGKYKTGKSCLYIKKLEDVDQKTLEKLIAGSVKEMRRRYK